MGVGDAFVGGEEGGLQDGVVGEEGGLEGLERGEFRVEGVQGGEEGGVLGLERGEG